MITWAIPGQKVVCIASPDESLLMEGEVMPYVDQILTIREVLKECLNCRPDTLYLLFEEIVNPEIRPQHREAAFRYDLFRPLKKTNIDVFLKILNDAPKEVERETLGHA